MGLGKACVLLLGAGLSVSACTSQNATSSSGQPGGLGLSSDQAVAQVLTSLGDPTVLGADVIADPSDNPGGLPWVRVRLDSNAGDGVKEGWLGMLVEGAVGELMRATQPTISGVLGGAEIVDTVTSGATARTPLGMGAAAGGLDFDSPSDADLRVRVEAIAHKFGLDVSSVEILHPLDSAIAVTFTVPDGHVSWTITQLSRELAGSPTDVEGVYIELDSPRGQPLLLIGGAERIPGGGLSFAPGQDHRFGALHA